MFFFFFIILAMAISCPMLPYGVHKEVMKAEAWNSKLNKAHSTSKEKVVSELNTDLRSWLCHPAAWQSGYQ